MKVYTEALISEMKPVKPSKDSSSSALCFLEGPCMQFGKVNRNNRIYSRKLIEDRILNNPTVQECIKNRAMLGEGGHPENRVDISYPEVALAVEKLWIPEDATDMLWGRFAILDTPTGRILETLVKYGTRLGISARAVADSVQKNGHEVIVESSYELITFDAVPEPGFQCARLEQVDSVSKSVDKMSVQELKESASALRSFKNPVFESRIRSLDKEISKRENKASMHTVLESINRLSDIVNKSADKLLYIKYEKELSYLLKEAKSLINETKQLSDKAKLKKTINESKHLISTINSNDFNIAKFNTDRVLNENINTAKIFSKDNTTLEKMCSNFRRNSYE